MAVESRLQQINMNNLFSSQYRECLKPQANAQIENAGVGYIQSPIQISESDLTYTFNNHHHQQQSSPAITKRQRDYSEEDDDSIAFTKRRAIAFDSSSELFYHHLQQQQQSELERFVNQQTETLRMELESRQRTQTRLLASAFETAVLRRIKVKDEEIARMGKLNWVLQERVKNLYVENQIWRDLAQNNEATANNLRSNLEQVLAQIDEFPTNVKKGENDDDDAESSCGSCDGGELTAVNGGGGELTAVNGGCRQCGERRASVLVLPCRHLCLCTVCGSALVEVCPVCDMVMNASVHVNMSS